MKKYSMIIFDLDGTLIDPVEGIINSVRYSLKYFGIEELDEVKLRRFIGPPLHESYQNIYKFSPDDAKKAVQIYREFFTKRGIFENQVYPEISSILQKLNSKKCILFVGTSKPTVFAKQILEYFKLHHLFREIVGSNLDLTRVSKNEIIDYIIKNHNIENLENLLMIGDTPYDIEGANVCGIDSVAVLYGYGTQSSIEKCKPTYTCKDIQELSKLLELCT